MLKDYHIEVRKLQVACRVGHSPEERAFSRLITFDLDLELDAGGSFKSDELSDTLDYRLIVSALQKLAAETEWSLLEKLCADAANELLSLHSAIKVVHISALKPIFSEAQGVVVKASFSRQQ